MRDMGRYAWAPGQDRTGRVAAHTDCLPDADAGAYLPPHQTDARLPEPPRPATGAGRSLKLTVLAAYTQRRLARARVGGSRLPCERPLPPLCRVRRAIAALLLTLGTPARASQPCERSPRHPAIKGVA